MGLWYNNAYYFYVKNVQGDITGIVDSSGNLVVEYQYDEWGKLLSTSGSLKDTLGKDNPFRYRGYYYDVESGLYYLQSRYYDPTIRRFVNVDHLLYYAKGALGMNAFLYCENNPVYLSDPTGELAYPAEIHKQVQRNFINRYSYLGRIGMEQYVYFSWPKSMYQKYGFADLVLYDTGEIWEVKPVGTDRATTYEQLDSYVRGYFDNKGKKNKEGRMLEAHTIKFQYKNYEVSYWFAEPGIIYYSYREMLPERAPSPSYSPVVDDQTVIFILLGIVALGCIAAAPATGGGSLGGLAFIF